MHPHLTLPDLTANDIARFWRNVDQRDPDDCWNYRRRLSHRYPQMKVRGRWYTVSRLSYALNIGPIPDGMQVCHHCDNSHCVNPAHLFLGTQKDNEADKLRKGRTARGERHGSKTKPESVRRGERHWSVSKPERVPRGDRNGAHTHPERVLRGDAHYTRRHPAWVARGERQGLAKLTQEQVDEIRQRYVPRHGSKAALARAFGVSQSTIGRIIDGKTWRNS